MNGSCASVVDDGVIRGVLATIDCQTRAYAQGGYLALTTGSGVFQTALTVLLTVYVALIGWRMLFAQGDTRLSDAPGIALRIGVILALVTSWSTFQTLVFDLADRAPLEIAAIASSPWTAETRSSLAADPVTGLETVYNELTQVSAVFGQQAGVDAKAYASPQAAAAEAVSLASGALFFSSVGVISAATLAIGILTAVGPIFIAMALMVATRGIFIGWVRAMLAAALTPLVGWLLLVLMLTVIEPWIAELGAQRLAMRLDPQTAISTAALIFVFAAGQAALVIGACVMALGFHMPTERKPATEVRAPAGAAPAGVAGSVGGGILPSRAERLALDLQRDQAHAAARTRAAASASAAAAPGRSIHVGAAETSRLGDGYRRPTVTSRPAGASR
ncbi:type IV secretion system protein [Phenylobacterium kunshanense]|uniref:Type VI secretion protein n=1 Tax=Phenylobacterium kunshanense TaxID=1445034 RepID=A0A328BKT1_9CAUL|nr:type IV secretion system protein [Phenylobacterium kunshanense]RAK66554.1 type VI secretion protein [Phenylobacterium kunshanense]